MMDKIAQDLFEDYKNKIISYGEIIYNAHELRELNYRWCNLVDYVGYENALDCYTTWRNSDTTTADP